MKTIGKKMANSMELKSIVRYLCSMGMPRPHEHGYRTCPAGGVSFNFVYGYPTRAQPAQDGREYNIRVG
jgi:hypothetical protein